MLLAIAINVLLLLQMLLLMIVVAIHVVVNDDDAPTIYQCIRILQKWQFTFIWSYASPRLVVVGSMY